MSARALFLRDDLAAAWRGREPFAQAATQPGEVYRAREGRRTLLDGATVVLRRDAAVRGRRPVLFS